MSRTFHNCWFMKFIKFSLLWLKINSLKPKRSKNSNRWVCLVLYREAKCLSGILHKAGPQKLIMAFSTQLLRESFMVRRFARKPERTYRDTFCLHRDFLRHWCCNKDVGYHGQAFYRCSWWCFLSKDESTCILGDWFEESIQVGRNGEGVFLQSIELVLELER